jgi:flagellar protein FliO/FliZ
MKQKLSLLPLFAAVPAMAAGPGMAGVSGMVLSLLLILGLFILAAWLARRYLPQIGKPGPVKVIGTTAVGPRERVVVVEIGDTWLVLGVGGGQVRTLHSQPKPQADGTES